MRPSHCRGRLYLNGQFVGNIAIQGWDGPWGFGQFEAAPAFAAFAAPFNEWARLMHSPETARRLTPNVADALRKVECELYAIAAKIYVEELRAWRCAAIVNIDGMLIEWKETWSAEESGGSALSATTAGREDGRKASH